MRDIEIRNSLIAFLQARSKAPIPVAHELKLGKGFVKADIVAFYRQWQCFEIKSNYDSLRRLSGQLTSYGEYFHKTTVVCGDAHTNKVINSSPAWIGIIEVSASGCCSYRRKPHVSPHYLPMKILECLWKDELLKVLADFEINVGRRSSRAVILNELGKQKLSKDLLVEAGKLIHARKTALKVHNLLR